MRGQYPRAELQEVGDGAARRVLTDVVQFHDRAGWNVQPGVADRAGARARVLRPPAVQERRGEDQSPGGGWQTAGGVRRRVG